MLLLWSLKGEMTKQWKEQKMVVLKREQNYSEFDQRFEMTESATQCLQRILLHYLHVMERPVVQTEQDL